MSSYLGVVALTPGAAVAGSIAEGPKNLNKCITAINAIDRELKILRGYVTQAATRGRLGYRESGFYQHSIRQLILEAENLKSC